MDLDMPIIGGLEATKIIRKMERIKHLPPIFIIIFSGNVDLEC